MSERATAKRVTWPTTPEANARLSYYKSLNLRRSLVNPNENWMAAHLATTGLKWTRQAVWGFCIFDFWSAAKGIAVEVDGPEHRAGWDAFRDRQNLERSGILVLRVRNRNEDDAARALAEIAASGSWNSRRKVLGLKACKGQPDEYTLPPQVKSPPKAKAPPAPRAEPKPRERKLPQARCAACQTRVRTRRPDGAIRCRCGKSTG